MKLTKSLYVHSGPNPDWRKRPILAATTDQNEARASVERFKKGRAGIRHYAIVNGQWRQLYSNAVQDPLLLQALGKPVTNRWQHVTEEEREILTISLSLRICFIETNTVALRAAEVLPGQRRALTSEQMQVILDTERLIREIEQ